MVELGHDFICIDMESSRLGKPTVAYPPKGNTVISSPLKTPMLLNCNPLDDLHFSLSLLAAAAASLLSCWPKEGTPTDYSLLYGE